jgi:hypothetical protein
MAQIAQYRLTHLVLTHGLGWFPGLIGPLVGQPVQQTRLQAIRLTAHQRGPAASR